MLPNLHGAGIAPMAQRHEAGQPPEPRHPMPATDQAFAVQELPHLSGAIRFSCLLMEEAHTCDEGPIGLPTRSLRSVLPNIEAIPTDLQHSTQGCHQKLPVMRLNEPVLHWEYLVKYLAAFFKCCAPW